MASRKSAYGAADGRPRIFIRPAVRPGWYTWRIGWHGAETMAQMASTAFEAAMMAVDWKDAVIFWEGTRA